MKKIFLSVFSITAFFSLFSQDIISVKGKIVDKRSGQPISYTSLSVDVAKTGSISNEDGEFILQIEGKYQKSSIRVSRIGYAPFVIKLPDLIAVKGLIELTQQSDSLEEVVIRPLNAVELVKGAFEKVSGNYSQKPLRMQGFYREFNIENDQTVELSEALLGIYFSPYNKSKNEVQLKLIKGRKSNAAAGSKVQKYAYFSGMPQSLLKTDVAHGSEEFDVSDFLRNSDMKVVDIWSFDGDQVYEISFDQKDNVKKALYKGKIFIETKNLAIVSIDFGISPKGLEYFKLIKGAGKTIAAMQGIKMNLLKQHCVINYKKVDSLWYLNDAVANYQYHFIKSKKGKGGEELDVKINVGCEFLVTDIASEDAAPFSKGEELDWKGPFSKKITDYDPVFWQGQNYIVPSQKIKNITEKLKGQE